nr:hypothetical protein [Tanacetum cinerariifolium]
RGRCDFSRIPQVRIQSGGHEDPERHRPMGRHAVRDAGRYRARPQKSVDLPPRERHHRRPVARRAAAVRLRRGAAAGRLSGLDG